MSLEHRLGVQGPVQRGVVCSDGCVVVEAWGDDRDRGGYRKNHIILLRWGGVGESNEGYDEWSWERLAYFEKARQQGYIDGVLDSSRQLVYQFPTGLHT